jgi:predicted RNA-binding Zn-ribbon protein involved in translation (DUF1610 family)
MKRRMSPLTREGFCPSCGAVVERFLTKRRISCPGCGRQLVDRNRARVLWEGIYLLLSCPLTLLVGFLIHGVVSWPYSFWLWLLSFLVSVAIVHLFLWSKGRALVVEDS